MEKNTTSVEAERMKGENKSKTVFRSFSSDVIEKNPLAEQLSSPKYKIFLDYLEWLGLEKDPNLIVLSPSRHYYYDDEDLKEVTTVLNLKHLNHIKQVKNFLRTVNYMLPQKSFFIGSFIDRKHQYGFLSTQPDNHMQDNVDPVENGIISRIPILNMIYDFMDSRTNNRNMSVKSVSHLLESTGFKVLDVTEINGITCFCAQKIISPGEE
jgi:hypothetical protein